MNSIQIFLISFFTVSIFALSLLIGKIYSVVLRLSPGAFRGVMIFCLVGPAIFVLSMALSRLSDGLFVRVIYYLSSVLGGVMFYLLILGFLLSVLLLLGKVFGFALPIYIALGFVFVALAFSAIGLIQAKFIKVTKYEILLPNAPKEWDGKRAVLVSDTHFGLVNHKKFSDKVVKKILDVNPSLVFHAGDFYDGPKNDTTLITESWKGLTQKMPVFYAPGNHEEYGDYAGFLTSIKNAGVNVIVDGVVDYQGVQIAGISYRNKKQASVADGVLKSLKVDSTKPLILINHPPTFQNSALEIGADLMLSGHTHKGQFWPFYYVVKSVYGKYIYGANVDGSLTTITTSGIGTAGVPMRLFNTPELVEITFRVK